MARRTPTAENRLIALAMIADPRKPVGYYIEKATPEEQEAFRTLESSRLGWHLRDDIVGAIAECGNRKTYDRGQRISNSMFARKVV